MGWEQRGRHAFYYRSVRVPDLPHPVKLYLGRGEAARKAAAAIAEKHARRVADGRANRELAKRFEDIDRLSADLHEWSQILGAAFLILAGFRKRKGEWRMSKLGTSEKKLGHDASKSFKPTLKYARESMKVDIQDANRGGEEAERAKQNIAHWLREFPELVDEVGTLIQRISEGWFKAIAGPDLVETEAIRREINVMRRELEGEQRSPLEELLVSDIVIAVLGLRDADHVLAEQDANSPGAYAWLRRAEFFQRRLHNAMKALERVRSVMKLGRTPPADIGVFRPSKVRQRDPKSRTRSRLRAAK